MKRTWIKLIGLLLIAVLGVSLLAGCSGGGSQAPKSGEESQDTPEGTSSTGQEQASTTEPEPITLPIVKEPLTLTVWTKFKGDITSTPLTSYGDTKAFQELEKRTGIHIEFQHVSAADSDQQFNLMIASQDLPDMIGWKWYKNVVGGPQALINNGSIISLNEGISKYGPNYKKLMDQDPAIRKEATTDSGDIFAYMQIAVGAKPGEPLRRGKGLMLRQDWLDKLGLKAPTTMDEWYNVLKAFREQDPNGNGKQDEIPFVTYGQGDGYKRMATAWGILDGFYVDPASGQAKYGPIQPVYKDYLTTMAKWYKEGLLDPEFAASDTKFLEARITGNLSGAWIGGSGDQFAYFTNMADSIAKGFKLVAVPMPIGQAGKSYFFEADTRLNDAGTAITSKDKNVKESVKWLDYQYSDEGAELMNFGIDGESYAKENGAYKYTDKVLKNPEMPFGPALATYTPIATTSAEMGTRFLDAEKPMVPGQLEAEQAWGSSDSSIAMPKLTLTTEESDAFSGIMNEINTYKDEMFVKFVMGAESLDNFDKFVQQIKNMGIDDALKIQNDALQRYNNR